jgi:predicted transglutaminase-like cysteine proteinase
MSDKQLDLEDDGSDGASAEPIEGTSKPDDDGSGAAPPASAPAPPTPAAPAPAPAPAPAADEPPAEGEDDAPEGKGNMIPRGRFNEVNTERKALLEQNQRLMEMLAQRQDGGAEPPAPAAPAPAPAPAAVDLKALRRERLAALASGEDDKALELDEQIEGEVMRQATQRAAQQMREERAAEEAQRAITEAQRVAAEAKATYPQLDNKSDQRNEDAIDFVVLKRDALIAAGTPAHKALQQAVDNAAKLFGWKPSAAPAAPAPAPTGAKPNPAEDRAVAARTRGAQAAAVQPPALGGTGNRTSEPARKEVAEMSESEFRSLSDAELDELGGNR